MLEAIKHLNIQADSTVPVQESGKRQEEISTKKESWQALHS